MAAAEAPVEESGSSPDMGGESSVQEPEGVGSHDEAGATRHSRPPLLDSTPAPVLNGGLSEAGQAALDAL
jgi:hypothetical protein